MFKYNDMFICKKCEQSFLDKKECRKHERKCKFVKRDPYGPSNPNKTEMVAQMIIETDQKYKERNDNGSKTIPTRRD